MTLQMLGLSGPGRVFTVKVQSQAQNVVLVALKPWTATAAAPAYGGRAIQQVRLPGEGDALALAAWRLGKQTDITDTMQRPGC